MKAKFVLLLLILPIFSTMSVSAQIPTAAISMTCEDSMVEIEYLYDSSYEFNPQNSSLICTLSNPTQYQETVELNFSTTSADIQANYPIEVIVGGNQDFDFEVTFTIDENITNSNSMNALMSINATVSAIQNAPPPNTAKDEVNNIVFSVLNLFESNSLYLHSDENKSIWSSFQMPNYSHHPYDMSEEKDQGVITIDQKYNINQVIDRKLTMDVGSEINANFSVYYEGDMDSTDNAGPCQPSNTPNDCDWLNITIYNENYILHKHTETPWPAGNWKNIQLSWIVGEDNATLNGTEDMNLTVHISMKVKGDYNDNAGPGGFFVEGEPAKFDISNASENDTGFVHFPFTGVYDVNSSTNGSLDSDGDGVIDENDDFPNDSNETQDSDGDGVGDNSDEFPQDGNEIHDDDGDGVGNNTDAFPQDGNETHDDDGDGVGNNTDAFPQDANETMDTDGDGVGDNEDVEPDNPDVRYSDDIKVEISEKSSYIIAGAIVFLALVILFVRRKQPPMNDTHSQFAYEESLFKDD